MTLPADWVCEILSPGHERKDLVDHLLLSAAVPDQWLLSPEERTLIVYGLDGGSHRLRDSVAHRPPETVAQVRVPPFESIAIDLSRSSVRPSDRAGRRPHLAGRGLVKASQR